MNQNFLVKIVIALIIILILIGIGVYQFVIFPNKKDSHGCLINKGYLWCDIKNKCIENGKEKCEISSDWILGEGKKIIGLNLNIMPDETVKWKTKDGEAAFPADGIYYMDVLNAEKITKWFDDLIKFLFGIGMKKDALNPEVFDEKENTLYFVKDKNACVLRNIDNPNQTSSLSLFCGNLDETLCNYNSSCGRACQTDSDCGFFTNGCAKRIVCRNKNAKFYNDCLNATSRVDELDIDINSCICLDNQCVPEKEKYRSKN